MNKQPFSLLPQEVAAFERDGYFGPFKAYEPEEIQEGWNRLRIDLQDRSNAPYSSIGELSGLSIGNYDRHLDVPFLARHVKRPQIVHRLNSVLGPNLLVWRTEFFPKYPGDCGTPWHQNSTFEAASGKVQLAWPKGSRKQGAITVWCAITDSNEENGCLKIMPGTQYTRFYDEKRGFSKKEAVHGFGYNFQELQYDPDWKPDESKAIPLNLKAGECIAFWSTLLHGSHPNVSDKLRMGFASRYVPTQVKIYPDTEYLEEFGESVSLDKWRAVLVSGKDTFKHNKIIA